MEVTFLEGSLGYRALGRGEARTGSFRRLRPSLFVMIIVILLSLISLPTLMMSPRSGTAHHIFSSGVNSPVWPMFDHDSYHSSASANPGPYDNSTKWIFGIAAPFTSSPVVGPDGTIYITGGDYRLYAINPDGSLKWAKSIGEQAFTPAISPAGTVLLPSAKHISSFGSDGTLLWSISIKGNLGSPVTLDSKGDLYLIANNTVYVMNPAGGEVIAKSTTTTTCGQSAAAVDSSGRIYCAGASGSLLYSFLPNGTLAWKALSSPSPTNLSPSIGPDGTIYIGSSDGFLYGVLPNGVTKWVNTNLHKLHSDVVVRSDGVLFAAGSKLGAVNPANGTAYWTLTCYVPPSSTYTCLPLGTVNGMALDSNGILYVAQLSSVTNMSSLVAMNTYANGAVRWIYNVEDKSEVITGPPAIGANGALYFATSCATCVPNGSTMTNTSSSGGNSSSTSQGIGRLYAIGRSGIDHPITVTESGLPPYAAWSINFDGETFQTVSATMVFSTSYGSHLWSAYPTNTVQIGVRYMANNASGSLNVTGYSASFALSYSKQYDVNVVASPLSGGSTNVTQSGWYYPMTILELNASAATGYKFHSWSSSSTSVIVTNSTLPMTSLIVNGTGTVAANFDVGLTLNSGIGGTISYSGAQVQGIVQSGNYSKIFVRSGTQILLSAHANTGYSFVGWNGVQKSQMSLQALTLSVNTPVVVYAYFVSTTPNSTTTSNSMSSQSTLSSATTVSAQSSSASQTAISQVSTSAGRSGTSLDKLISISALALTLVLLIAMFALIFYRRRHRTRQGA